jgi:hypothetical protein
VSLKDIRQNALSHSLDAEQTQELLDALVKAGWLRETTTPTAGRSRRRWVVNPKLFEGELQEVQEVPEDEPK